MVDLERPNSYIFKKVKKPAISIIIPIFKAEIYLMRCINSILSQTFTDWELLLIDDGSPDNSGAICDEIQSQNAHLNIKVYHQPNSGVASAREKAMQNAKGIYSIHIDPDDWIEPCTLEKLYQKAIETNADIVVYDFILEYGSRTEVLNQEVESNEKFLRQLLSQEKHGSLCNKLIRTDLYKQYDLHFPKEMICWEDLYICCNILMLHPCKIEYIPEALYHYDFFSNPNSMVRKASNRTLEGMKLFCQYFENKLPNNHKSWLYETKGMVLTTAYRCNLLTAKDMRELFPEINNWYINKYLHDYEHVIYCSVAQVLNGYSLKFVKLFQKWNKLFQRIKNKIKKL